MTGRVLRPYQVEACDTVEACHLAGEKWPLIQMATGSGKTVVFGEVIRRWISRRDEGRVLVLAERRELVEQTAQRIEWWCKVPVGIEMADRKDLTGDALEPPRVVVATVQTLARRLRLIPMDVRLVVIDEAHHAVAQTYLDTIAACPVDAYGLGVTATPERADGAALAFVFDRVVFSYSIRRGIEEGYLARVKPYLVQTDIDLSRVGVRAGDLKADELERAMMDDAAVATVAKAMVEQSGDLPAMVFTASVAHAHAVAARVNDMSGNANRCRAIDGSHKPAERREILARTREEGGMLANCALLTEGFDWPDIRVLGIARPTKSASLYCQMAGRGTRTAPGKDHVMILDFIPRNTRHDLVTSLNIYGSAVPDDVQEYAYKKALQEPGEYEIDELLEAAQAEWAEYQEAHIYTLAARDPFRAIGISDAFYREPAVRRPASERQIEALVKFGMAPKEAEGMSAHRAHLLIDRLILRIKLGLSSAKQVRLLAKYKIDARQMTFAIASAAITALAAKGWRK